MQEHLLTIWNPWKLWVEGFHTKMEYGCFHLDGSPHVMSSRTPTIRHPVPEKEAVEATDGTFP
jgi:hypothetical protein